jgi:plastocyanin
MATTRSFAFATVLLLLLTGAACGDDGSVSSEGSGTATASGTGTGTHTGSASGTGTHTGSPSGEECETEGAVLQSAEAELEVTLGEWVVEPAHQTVEAGVVEIVAVNKGAESHELVIVRAAQDELVVEDGEVQEDALPDGAFVGEIEPFDSGATCEAHFELPAGTYTFFCNIVEEEPDGTRESHFEEGMVTTVEVT